MSLAGLGTGLLGTSIFVCSGARPSVVHAGAQTGLAVGEKSAIKCKFSKLTSPSRIERARNGSTPLRAEVILTPRPREVWKRSATSAGCRSGVPVPLDEGAGPLRPAPAPSTSIGARSCSGPPRTVTEVIPKAGVQGRHQSDRSGSTTSSLTATGTRVVESRRADRPIPAVPAFLAEHALGGTGNFEQELVEGMNASLAWIKAAAERR